MHLIVFYLIPSNLLCVQVLREDFSGVIKQGSLVSGAAKIACSFGLRCCPSNKTELLVRKFFSVFDHQILRFEHTRITSYWIHKNSSKIPGLMTENQRLPTLVIKIEEENFRGSLIQL